MKSPRSRPTRFGDKSSSPSKKGKQMQNSESLRTIEVPISKGNINDAFSSLLLMTGHMHDGEVVTSVEIPPSILTDVRNVVFQIKKETTH